MNEQVEQQIRERVTQLMQEARDRHLAKGVPTKTIDRFMKVEKQRAYVDARKEITGK